MTLWCVQGQIYLCFTVTFTESIVWGIKCPSFYASLSVCWIMREVSWKCGPPLPAGCHYWCFWVSGMFRALAAGRTDRSGRFEGSSWKEWDPDVSKLAAEGVIDPDVSKVAAGWSDRSRRFEDPWCFQFLRCEFLELIATLLHNKSA